jgi:hypothetical protein
VSTATETVKLPSLDSPSDDKAHIAINQGIVAYCGFRGPTPHRNHGLYTPGDVRCQCGAPMCPTCVDMARVEWNSGGIVP